MLPCFLFTNYYIPKCITHSGPWHGMVRKTWLGSIYPTRMFIQEVIWTLGKQVRGTFTRPHSALGNTNKSCVFISKLLSGRLWKRALSERGAGYIIRHSKSPVWLCISQFWDSLFLSSDRSGTNDKHYANAMAVLLTLAMPLDTKVIRSHSYPRRWNMNLVLLSAPLCRA